MRTGWVASLERPRKWDVLRPERAAYRLFRALLIGGLWLSVTGCSAWFQHRLADTLSAQSVYTESDPGLAREAGAFYLVLSESVLREAPDHLALGEAVAAGLTRYAFAFVSQEADFTEATDPRRANALRERATRLYHRARHRALRGIQASQGGRLDLSLPQNTLTKNTLGLAYWAAAAWGGEVALSTDDPEVVADFPKVLRLAHWAWEIDPAYGRGDLASLMGSLEAARPGGSLDQARAYFDQAIALSAPFSVSAMVTKAERWAVLAGQRAVFEDLLQQALAVRYADDHPDALTYRVYQARAQWLLNRADELF